MTPNELIESYKTDVDSPVHKLRYYTRQHYGHLCKRIAQDLGELPLDKIKIALVEGESGPQHQQISGFSHPHHPIYTVRAMLRVIGSMCGVSPRCRCDVSHD